MHKRLRKALLYKRILTDKCVFYLMEIGKKHWPNSKVTTFFFRQESLMSTIMN